MKEVDVKKIMEQIQRENAGRSDDEIWRPVNQYLKERIERCAGADKIVVFGAGNFGQRVLDILKEQNIDSVVCFCDNNPENWGKTREKLKIRSALEACIKYPNALYLITPKRGEYTIAMQLMNIGIVQENLLQFRPDYCER